MPLAMLERREQLRRHVDAILASERNGALTRTRETASIDFKEEAGRRNGPNLEPGHRHNDVAATKLADEVACMANSPGGGALILGVEDRTGLILGTQLDAEWLRSRIHHAIHVAPQIEERRVAGQRLLVLYVAEASEPIADTSGRLRWRVADSCQPVERSEWWQHREHMRAYDPMASRTDRTAAHVTGGALRLLRADLDAEPSQTDEDLLRRIGALRSDGYLTQAGSLLLTPASRSLLELTVLDVPGGEVLNLIRPDASLSLREQLDVVEQALTVLNRYTESPSDGFSRHQPRLIPAGAVREAVLNGLIHRDWGSTEPTAVRWLGLDATLEVRSPGSFTGGVNAGNVLTHHHARYPALADLFRASGLVEKQGLGVDRMYASMIPLGHRPPSIVEMPGPWVQCTLRGGDPIVPVARLFSRIIPVPRQHDSRIAVLVDWLLHHPFTTVELAARELQAGSEGAAAALRAASQCTVDGEPLVDPYQEAWVLSDTAIRIAEAAREAPWREKVLTYVLGTAEACEESAVAWAGEFGHVSTGDVMRLTGASRGTAQRTLASLTEREVLTRQGSGRSTTYVPAPSPY